METANEPDEERPKLIWRELSVNDVESLGHVADIIHPDLPESNEVFSERIKLFPEGCLALVDMDNGQLYGYVISHPIRRWQPPSLDSLLQEIAPDADQYYIHDLAVLPEARGTGFAREGVKKLSTIAEKYDTVCLISVYGTSPFWSRFGFNPVEMDSALIKKLEEYGEDATYLECRGSALSFATSET